MQPGPLRATLGLAVSGLVLIATACGGSSTAADEATTSPATTAAASTTSTTSTSTTSTTTTSTTTSSTSTTTSSTTTTTTTTVEPLPDPALPASNAAFDSLALANPAASLTITRDGRVVLARASGTTIDGLPATSDAPMVVASVGKLLTAAMVARLDQAGRLDVDQPTPWALMGLTPDPGWNDVTPRELLAHAAGMPVVRHQWFVRSDDCRSFLTTLVDDHPQTHRGRWTYSNGNYCALGLLIEAVTATPLDRAAQSILLDPIGASGVHLTTDGQLPTDVSYAPGLDRLARLGGAGSFLVSTDDLAGVMNSITPADREIMTWPGLIFDQYGWGHTGSVDGAVSCVWMMESDRTVVAATVAGNRPATGGDVCDRVVPALAADLGIPAGRPERTPP